MRSIVLVPPVMNPTRKPGVRDFENDPSRVTVSRSIDHGVEVRLLIQVTPPAGCASYIRRYPESGLISHVGLSNRIVAGTLEVQIALVREVVERTGAEW